MSRAPIELRITRIHDESRRIRADAAVHRRSIIETLGERVHSAQLKAARQTMVDIDVQRVVRTQAFRQPRGCVRQLWIRELRARGIVKRSGAKLAGHGAAGANRRERLVHIRRKQFVVSVRAVVSHGNRSIGSNRLLNFETVRDHRGSVGIRLHTAGRNLAARKPSDPRRYVKSAQQSRS